MNYYFVGIKGSGMSGLALIMKDLGNEVRGADVSKYLFTQDNLLDKGIIIDSLDDMHYQDSDVIVLGNAFVDKSNRPVKTLPKILFNQIGKKPIVIR